MPSPGDRFKPWLTVADSADRPNLPAARWGLVLISRGEDFPAKPSKKTLVFNTSRYIK